ncbi:ATPase family associated with various cellular activities (AAA) [Amycolatopsis lurida]|uniref:ATPase AAA n=1 Tax=Amycolatopsis lurida NRRL 2430 TaxID=1460371 RepID=A0A2P2FP00_AMYLU|nr:ATP-binding protein [Amycolatopsis lurida]KFU78453.1 ATPase AAA [Amycolatopsis lurida NRRL 2430]SEE26546.1 ATPase family associated with various cellular activities (AAA) [Amycolatopsis lurida]
MTASGEHVKALVRSHAAGDDDAFYAVALQVAAKAARQGHSTLASDLKQMIDAARQSPVADKVTAIARPRGDLAELLTAGFPDVTLSDLVGPSSFKDTLARVLREQRERQALIGHGYTPVHRLLLEGPPGTGKTMTAGVLARELSLPLLTVRLDSLLSKFMGETASKLRTVFEAAATQRAVYLFDEFDALGAHRGGNDVGEARRIVNAFLVFLEEVSAESIVVAATNHRSILDHALFRRFDLVVKYGLPEPGHAVEVMKARLGLLGRGLRWTTVRPHTADLSHAELVKAAEEAAKQAILRGDDHVVVKDVIAALDARRAASGE